MREAAGGQRNGVRLAAWFDEVKEIFDSLRRCGDEHHGPALNDKAPGKTEVLPGAICTLERVIERSA
ncbi:hypothetical protein ACUXST_002463 [Sphingomonas sp. F9_3S_D5_B_2]